MNIVLDTNIVASAMYFGGKPARLVELVVAHEVNAFVSEQIVSEYYATTERLETKYSRKNGTPPVKDIVSHCSFVAPAERVSVCRDADDDKFIECALEGNCLYIVSGDNDLLDLKSYEGVEIITVAEFFHRLKDTEDNQ